MESSLPVGAVEPPAPRRLRHGLVIVLAVLLAGSLAGNILQFLRRPEPTHSVTAQSAESYDSRGRLVARFTFRDGDAFPSRAEQFDRTGRLDSIGYDDDADGWYERQEVTSRNGLTFVNSDRDGDGLPIDHSVLLRGGVRLMEIADEDRDGWLETWRAFDAQGRPRMIYRDLDHDGIAEKGWCVDEQGTSRALPDIDCPR